MPGFFLNSKSKPKKRKLLGKKKPLSSKNAKQNEEVYSEDEDDESIASGDEGENREAEVEEEADEETAAEKRLRLAKDYIQQLETEEKARAQDDDWKTDPVA